MKFVDWLSSQTDAMVTPIHRFQSIKSVVKNSLRYHAKSTPGYHSGGPSNNSQTCSGQITSSTRNLRSSQQDVDVGRSVEVITTITPRKANRTTAKLKYGVWLLFICVSVMFVINDMQGPGTIVLMWFIAIVGGLLSLYDSTTAKASASLSHQMNGLPSSALEQTNEDSQSNLISHHQPLQSQHSNSSLNQVPTSHHQQLEPHAAELPPPPYRIAMMLRSQDDIATTESAQIMGNTPPPSYEKAVT